MKIIARAMHPDLALFHRQPGEAPAAFHAFQHYRNLPVNERSRDRAWREHSRDCLGRVRDSIAPGRWNGWQAEWSWKMRAGAYDDEMDRVEVAVVQAKAETWAAAKVEFREAWRVDMSRIYRKLIGRAEEMLDQPVTEKIIEDEVGEKDGQIVVHREVHVPNKWRYGDIARMLSAAHMLAMTIAETPNDAPTEEEAIRAWAEREGIPVEKALEEYRRIEREIGSG